MSDDTLRNRIYDATAKCLGFSGDLADDITDAVLAVLAESPSGNTAATSASGDDEENRPMTKIFQLVRTEDVTGISGTGVVAEGAQFTDGTVALRWLDTGVSEQNRARGVRPTTVIHESVSSVEALHGHGGATQVRWVNLADTSDPRVKSEADSSHVLAPRRGHE